jgi:hypothetical protein
MLKREKRAALTELGGAITTLILTNPSDYPSFGISYDDEWSHVTESIDRMRKRLGEATVLQLHEMVSQARMHYDEGYALSAGISDVGHGDPGHAQLKLGSHLLQDVEEVARGRQPYAYPKRLYRWSYKALPLDPKAVPLSPTFAGIWRKVEALLSDMGEYPEEEFAKERMVLRADLVDQRYILGADLANMIIDMLDQISVHFSDRHPGLARGLARDIARIMCGRTVPFSYGRDLYRWADKKTLASYYKAVRDRL